MCCRLNYSTPQIKMALIILIIILIILPIFLLFLLQEHRKNTSVVLPPGPPALPIIGNILQYDTSNPPLHLWKLSRKYGPIMSLRLGPKQAVVISSAKLAKDAFKTYDLQFSNRPILRGPKSISYNYMGVAFTPYNNCWREMKKIFVMHLLNSNRVEQFRHVREDEVSRMIEKISKLAAARVSEPINVSDIAMCLVRNIIYRVAFSKRFEGESRFDSLIMETQILAGSYFVSDLFPFMGWVDELTGINRRLKKNFKDCDKVYQQLIDEHLDPNRPKPEQEDLIDIFLGLQKNPDQNTTADLTMDHIKAMLMDVFIGATDTSKVTVEWSMTLLMKNPEAMMKVQEEVRSVGKNKGFVDEDDIRRLEYLKAVIKESMRMQPPAQIIPRETTERCIIDGYEVPAKTLVLVNVLAIGRDALVWDKPEEFIPERFMGTSVDFRGQYFELVPFGAGRRICPGLPIALPTVELALANLLYKFDWKMPHGIKIDDLDFDIIPGLTQHKKNALTLMATKFI